MGRFLFPLWSDYQPGFFFSHPDGLGWSVNKWKIRISLITTHRVCFIKNSWFQISPKKKQWGWNKIESKVFLHMQLKRRIYHQAVFLQRIHFLKAYFIFKEKQRRWNKVESLGLCTDRKLFYAMLQKRSFLRYSKLPNMFALDIGLIVKNWSM